MDHSYFEGINLNSYVRMILLIYKKKMVRDKGLRQHQSFMMHMRP